MGTIIRATAPLRLDFAGGWTDVPPFSVREGGMVVNAAITPRVEAEFEPGGDGIVLRAEDLQLTARVRQATDLARDGRLDLHKAALRMFPTGPGTLRTRSAVPPGSGLGSSGALDVALVAALARARGDRLTPEEIATHAWYLETVEAGLPGGRQDQCAAALGGFHRLGFQGDDLTITPLRLDPAFAEELSRRTVICYTGRSRVSSKTIARVMRAYEQGDATVLAALRDLIRIAEDMAPALEAGDLAGVGRLLSANWSRQVRLDRGMRTDEMVRLEAAMDDAGSLGGKAAGAGAGGAMFFLMEGDVQRGVDAARRAGAEVLPAGWSPTGVEWC